MALEVQVANNTAGVSPELQACLLEAIELVGEILKEVAKLGNTPTSRGCARLTIFTTDSEMGSELIAQQIPASEFPDWVPPRTN